MKQYQTSPRRQYVATGIFAILAMISGLAVLHKDGHTDFSAQTMSASTQQSDNGHSESLEYLESRP